MTIEEMRAVDAEAIASVGESVLVERAGTAAATWALRLMGGAYGRRVVVVAGKGNNGADGKVAARLLGRRGARVGLIDPARLSFDGPLARAKEVDLVIDAAYGTGFRGSYRAPKVAAGVPVLAVDIPSGVNGDTGEACGEPLRADLTVTFAGLKPGLLLGEGALLAGRVEVADIGLDVSRARAQLVEDSDVIELWPRRPSDAHKWTSAVAIVAGSPGMFGAAELAVNGAYRAGAGMVRLGVPGARLRDVPGGEAVAEHLAPGDWADDALRMAGRCAALVVGPGLGRSATAVSQVRRLVGAAHLPLVIDADGLFALGGPEEAPRIIGPPKRQRPVVLTPHWKEMARLIGRDPGPDRMAAARGLASRTKAVVLLKGPATVIAEPGGDVLIAAAGDARLATAGTGDVLAGMIGALLARGMEPLQAAGLAAHVHGRAAALGDGEGMVARELPSLVARWLSGHIPSGSDRLAVAWRGGGRS